MAIVPVPEASVSEENSPVFRKNNIRISWQGAIMQPEAEPGRMQATSQRQFRFGVLTPDAGHHPAANLRGNNVSHERLPMGKLDVLQR